MRNVLPMSGTGCSAFIKSTRKCRIVYKIQYIPCFRCPTGDDSNSSRIKKDPVKPNSGLTGPRAGGTSSELPRPSFCFGPLVPLSNSWGAHQRHQLLAFPDRCCGKVGCGHGNLKETSFFCSSRSSGRPAALIPINRLTY